MAHKHRDELIRFANAEKGTKVWFKHRDVWCLQGSVSWYNNNTYIVDDNQAEIRKQFINNSNLEIEYHNKLASIWLPSKITNVNQFNPKTKYRIKPKHTFSAGEYVCIKYVDAIFVIVAINKQTNQIIIKNYRNITQEVNTKSVTLWIPKVGDKVIYTNIVVTIKDIHKEKHLLLTSLGNSVTIDKLKPYMGF